MSNNRSYHKPKWQEPEITDFTEQPQHPKYYCQQNCGLPPTAGGIATTTSAAARRRRWPNSAWVLNPYCRPNGFNYGYGAWPHR